VKREIKASEQETLRFNIENSGEKILANYEFNQEKSRQKSAETISMHKYPLCMIYHLS